MLIHGNLAGENVPKGRECVVKGLVVYALVKVLDENVAHSRLAYGRVGCDHMMRQGRPLIVSKFIVSRALSASVGC